MSNVLDYKPARTVYAVIVDHWSLVFAVGCCCIARCVHMALPKLTKSQNTHTHSEWKIFSTSLHSRMCVCTCAFGVQSPKTRALMLQLSLSLSLMFINLFIHRVLGDV